MLEQKIFMTFSGILTPPAKVTPPPPSVLKFFNNLPPSPKTFYSPPSTRNGCFGIFCNCYFQQAHCYISEAIITGSMSS